jgi:hypothetical protein
VVGRAHFPLRAGHGVGAGPSAARPHDTRAARHATCIGRHGLRTRARSVTFIRVRITFVSPFVTIVTWSCLVACSAGSAVGVTSDSQATDPVMVRDDAFFVTQWGPTRFNAAGMPDGADDCGPTTLVMVGATRGIIASPTPDSAEDAIRRMRDLAHGGRTPQSAPTYGPMMLAGLAANDLFATDLVLDHAASDADLAVIDESLANGDLVLVAGDPGNAWGRALDRRHAYLHTYDVAPDKDRFGHWVVVFETTDSGLYVIGDPLSTAGVVEIAREQLRTYLADGGMLAGAIAVGRAISAAE